METAIIDDRIMEELRDAVGGENVFDTIEERGCHSFDATQERSLPELVIRPHTTEHVARVVTIANRNSIPIYPRGSGTGLLGDAGYIRCGIVLDLKNMDKILALNVRDLTVTVQPGVLIRDLQDVAAKQKLFYPPGPGSAGFSTIGGNVAECSGGVTGMKYGVTRDYVLALEAVLPDGSIINTGRKTLKSVAGYDLTRFLVGSEGTLGIYTQITLKLLPMPQKRGTIISYFRDFHDAMKTSDSIQVENRILPRSIEFADMECIKAFGEVSEVTIPEGAKALLLIDVDGNEKNVTNDVSKIEGICRENSALKCEIVKREDERNSLWQMMKSVLPSLFKIATTEFSEAFCVPRSKVLEVLEKVYGLSATTSIRVAAFGHIGEGHIHLNIMSDKREDEVLIRGFIGKVVKEVVSIGGTLKAGQGVDDVKTEFVELELTDQEIGLMKDLKRMFDPKDIMNPGKIFT
ncbi:MAG: FAD-binding protein [Candidatus Scalindua sp. AMX11]|nr:MAG: FAD-binding protein [Candidatus Scalindua sp.]NOG85944.1 FAD-binding protein [Planctomycetota bacterium]RZV91423.1 MAG: FAD-binding protein [Candidatus Scalindua sp. SCAELEC01]TDE65982.1 MAG: FAD-binding protein [Candidatus Scalindua sp. AMX11]GJQ59290.1 MAG: glycolate oxidase subunit GlcD [Candidatus Scalindua sp.]